MLKILIVDDSIADAALTLKAVRQTDSQYVVATALDGDDALHLMAKEVYDLLLLDLNMPYVDGFELLRQLRNDKLSKAKVIAISGSRSISQQMLAYELGVSDFVFKEMDFNDYAYRIDTALAKLRGLNHGNI